MTDTIDTAEVVETTGVELEPYQPPALTLFGTSDPGLALERMATIAKLLDGVVRDRKLVDRISGREYVRAPGWAVLGGMTGLAPYTVWVKPLEDGTGWMARVEVRRVVDGVTIAAAEQLCSRGEPKWSRAADHALIGMAQTRAARRALMGPLQQIVELAGYAGGEPPDETVADEPELGRGKIPPEARPSRAQLEKLNVTLARLREARPRHRLAGRRPQSGRRAELRLRHQDDGRERARDAARPSCRARVSRRERRLVMDDRGRDDFIRPESPDDEVEETPEEMLQVAEAALVLSEMMIERGVFKLADLGSLPPIDPETKAIYLARARAREKRKP
jgi:hypothetical protein